MPIFRLPVRDHRPKVSPEIDPSTLSNYRDFAVKRTSIQIKVDWDNKILSGLVTYKLVCLSPLTTKHIILDTSYLNVHKVVLDDVSIKDFSIAAHLKPLGSALSIPYSVPTSAGGSESKESESSVSPTGKYQTLSIEFSTTDECTAVQWLNPEQTSGKAIPYLFSQCQAIHARSLFPCFDTPSIKSPFKIAIQSRYPTVSSGNPTSDSAGSSSFNNDFFSASEDSKVYYFIQGLPIPSYLFAIASGDIAAAPIGPRSLVYSEPSTLAACKYEFEADTENFIRTAEKIVFPYEWKTYNVLVLPPSFPYGGMENPNITFATPTLISGDRENVDVIAHELSHSWSGNLVTNCSWEHFWLNEGWTVYLERRIVAALHGEQYRHFSAIIGWKDLENSIESMGDSAELYSKLIVDLKDKQDPDDSFSTVPYEKGFNLLFYLENLLGGTQVFDPFIPYYFSKFKGKSLDSYQFIDTLYEFFPHYHEALASVDWETWLFSPGLPPKPKFDTSVADACYDLSDRWVDSALNSPADATEDYYTAKFSSKDIESWSSSQQVVFLDTLTDGGDKQKKNAIKWSDHPVAVSALDSVYNISKSTNAEVISRWYKIAVQAHLSNVYQSLADWLGTVGRMKFVRPGYIELKSVDKQLALETFEKNKLFYHPICRSLVAKDLSS